MSKVEKYIFAFTILVICIVPVLTLPLFDYEPSESSEKREKAESPVIYEEETGVNLEYFEELNAYLSDNFNFREVLVYCNAMILENLFNHSAESNVIVGKENWLYFAETTDDYTGTNVLSDKEIEEIRITIELMNEYADNKEAKFLFTIAPNKNTIYPENMPKQYLNGEVGNKEKVDEVLDDSYYLDLEPALKNQEEVTYLERDSHWNNYGAYIAFQEINDTLGVSEETFEITEEEVREEFEGDLEGMLYPVGGSLDNQVYYEFDNSFDYVTRFKTMDDLSIITKNEEAEGSIYVFRDSFGNALLEFFGRQYENVEFSRVVPYNLEEAVTNDYVVLELVERNIPNLLESAPIMEAPKREEGDVNNNRLNPDVLEVMEEGDYYHVYGYVNVEKTSEDEKILVESDEGIIYEAFPILESDLELEDKTGKKGFSLYIKKEELPSQDNIKLIYN